MRGAGLYAQISPYGSPSQFRIHHYLAIYGIGRRKQNLLQVPPWLFHLGRRGRVDANQNATIQLRRRCLDAGLLPVEAGVS